MDKIRKIDKNYQLPPAVTTSELPSYMGNDPFIVAMLTGNLDRKQYLLEVDHPLPVEL